MGGLDLHDCCKLIATFDIAWQIVALCLYTLVLGAPFTWVVALPIPILADLALVNGSMRKNLRHMLGWQARVFNFFEKWR